MYTKHTCILYKRVQYTYVYIVQTRTLHIRAYYTNAYTTHTCLLYKRVHYTHVYITQTHALHIRVHYSIRVCVVHARKLYFIYAYPIRMCIIYVGIQIYAQKTKSQRVDQNIRHPAIHIIGCARNFVHVEPILI